jgi:regulator of sirC expression with transglutaminase-like and TPR domain
MPPQEREVHGISSPLGTRSALRGEAGVVSRIAERARLEALISLMEDDSATVWREVRRSLRAAGKRAEPLLRKVASTSSSPRSRSRARELLLGNARNAAIRKLVRHVCRPDLDLESALFLLAQHHSPGLDMRPYRKAIDGFAQGFEQRARKCSSDRDRCVVLCEYLGQELLFGGELDDYHHPDNAQLHRTIERNTGLPLTITAIYMFVARRVGLRVAPLPLPGHVMLRAYAGEDSVIIDPFYYGHVRTERECLQYLSKNGLKFRPEWFRDADDRSMFHRQVLNLYRCYELRGLVREKAGLKTLLHVMKRLGG